MIQSDLYRFGFIVGRQGLKGVPEHWMHLQLSCDIHLYADPSLPLIHFGCGVLIGNAFHIGENSSIERLAEGVCTGDLRQADNIGGRWALIAVGPEPFVMNDAFGGQAVFYHAPSGTVSSHPELLAHACGAGICEKAKTYINSEAYKSRSVAYLPGNLTLYEGVLALIPNHRYVINARQQKRFYPLEPVKSPSKAEFYSRMEIYVSCLADYLRGREVAIGITGGIDCRVLVAGLWKHDVALRGITWGGSYCPSQEIPTINAIVSETGMSHKYIARGPKPLQASARNSGNIRRANDLPALHAECLSRDTIFITGHGGEIMRGFYNIGKVRHVSEFSAGAFYEAYNSSARGSLSEDYVSFAQRAFCDFYEVGEFQPASHSNVDVNDLFYWEHRMGMWSACFHLELDTACRAMPGYSDRTLFSIAHSLADNVRLKKKFLQDAVAPYSRTMADMQCHYSRA